MEHLIVGGWLKKEIAGWDVLVLKSSGEDVSFLVFPSSLSDSWLPQCEQLCSVRSSNLCDDMSPVLSKSVKPADQRLTDAIPLIV